MIDKSIPHYPLTMTKEDTDQYPRYSLPEGYDFVFYQKGDEVKWAEIEVSVGQFESIELGLTHFSRQFVEEQNLAPEERMLFVRSPAGEYVATATLWNGDHFGDEHQRIHWVAVKDTHEGKGLAKAMLTRLMDLYRELGYGGFLYLLTGTRNFPAVAIYRKFGFVDYTGPRSLAPQKTDEEFASQAKKAVAIINEQINKKE